MVDTKTRSYFMVIIYYTEINYITLPQAKAAMKVFLGKVIDYTQK